MSLVRGTLASLALVAATLSTGCVKRTIEVRVKDAQWVGMSRAGPGGLEPVLTPGAGPSFARFGTDETGQVAAARRQPGLMTIEWSGTPQPLVLVDPLGTLPPEKPGNGFAMRQGWVYGTYKVTPKSIVPAAARSDFAVPIVVMTPETNIAEVREVREPYHWPAYVFLPVGGVLTIVGTGALAVASNENTSDKELAQAAAAIYLLTGIPMVVYGIINALDSPAYVQVATPSEGPF